MWISKLDPVQGARWSAGAFWADSGAPAATDTDWEDAADWPIAYAAAEALTLGVFLEGVDVTSAVRSASWSLGQSDPLAASVAPSSASIELAAAGGFTPAVQDRVVILTDWTVLWAGRVEGWGETSEPERSATHDDPPTYSLACTDDLARGSLAELTDRQLGGNLMGLLDTLLRIAGMVGRAWVTDPDDHVAPDFDDMTAQLRSGNVLQLIGDAVYAAADACAWTPPGLRLASLRREYPVTDPAPVEDFGTFRSLTRSRGLSRIRNLVTLKGRDDTDSTTIIDDADSQDAYGVRLLAIDSTDWVDLATTTDAHWLDVLDADEAATIPGYLGPVVEYDVEARIGLYQHAATQLYPFDYVSDGPADEVGTTERIRVLQVSHRVTVDDWSVTFAGVGVGFSPIA